MAGRIVYSYPVLEAIRQGYVKTLRALVLNPRTLRYVRRQDDQEVEVGLDEVIRLGEEDADFRRSIVSSTETLNTIVDASIRELGRIRAATGDERHKIIASALNYAHCVQIVEACRSRGRRASYVHSREDSAANERAYDQLKNHELDVIVQVRKLGEGFDHPYLSVAAVFSIFRELSPFVQFVGRIMRAIVPDDPTSIQNQGTVVFHAGGNIAGRWEDFREFSAADREYFQQLLPIEGLDFSAAEELAVAPPVRRRGRDRHPPANGCPRAGASAAPGDGRRRTACVRSPQGSRVHSRRLPAHGRTASGAYYPRPGTAGAPRRARRGRSQRGRPDSRRTSAQPAGT